MTWILIPDGHDKILIRNRERFQQQRIDRAEDATVGADTERESQNRDGGESRSFNQVANSVSDVAEETVHFYFGF
jgi:hypothetical protein